MYCEPSVPRNDTIFRWLMKNKKKHKSIALNLKLWLRPRSCGKFPYQKKKHNKILMVEPLSFKACSKLPIPSSKAWNEKTEWMKPLNEFQIEKSQLKLKLNWNWKENKISCKSPLGCVELQSERSLSLTVMVAALCRWATGPLLL